MSDEVQAVKNNWEALVAAYVEVGGQPARDRMHNPCPICGDSSGFALLQGKGGCVGWQCYAGKSTCAGDGQHRMRSIIDLFMLARGMDKTAAIKHVLSKYGPGNSFSTTTEAKVDAAKRRGSAPTRKFPDGPAADECVSGIASRKGGEVVARYIYTDEKNLPCIKTHRINLPNGKKEFLVTSRVPNGWILGLGDWGVEKKTPPYRLYPTLKYLKEHEQDGATGESLTLHIAEGEKKADLLGELGFASIAAQGGSGRPLETDWSIAGKFDRVYVWLDNDAPHPTTGHVPGERFGRLVAEAIGAGADAPPVVLIDLAKHFSAREGQDVYDLVARWREDGRSDPEVVQGLRDIALGDMDRPGTAALAVPVRVLRRKSAGYAHQPPPMKPRKEGDESPPWKNFVFRAVDGKKVDAALGASVVIGDLLKITGGFPCRLRGGGEKPILFAHSEGRELPRLVSSAQDFEAWSKEIVRPAFNAKQDKGLFNYTSISNVYYSLGRMEREVREYVAIETRPHTPPIVIRRGQEEAAHYYTWQEPAQYEATGAALKGFVDHFNNIFDPAMEIEAQRCLEQAAMCQEPEKRAEFERAAREWRWLGEKRAAVQRAMIAAMACTPGWGGQPEKGVMSVYGVRPCFVIEADRPGSGKTTLAQTIGRIWGGYFSLDLANDKAEDQLLERLLSTDSLTKRVIIADNVKKVVAGSLIESIVTDLHINGKRLYHGDAQRPNVFSTIITSNGVRMSRDMSLRSYYIKLHDPNYNGVWRTQISEYIQDREDEIIADVMDLLGGEARAHGGVSDRWAVWQDAVLCKVLEYPAFQEWFCGDWGKLTLADCMEWINARRMESDEDLKEAVMLLDNLPREVAELRNYVLVGGSEFTAPAQYPLVGDVFISTMELCKLWEKIFNRQKLHAKTLCEIIDVHISAGRMKVQANGGAEMQALRSHRTAKANGWLVCGDLVRAYIREADKVQNANG